MSISELLDDVPHPWANLRVNDLTVDGTYTGPGGGSQFLEVDVIYGGDLWSSTLERKIYLNKTGRNVTLHMESGKASATSSGTTITVDYTLPETFMPLIRTELGGGEYIKPVMGITGETFVPARFEIRENNSINLIFSSAPGSGLSGFDNTSFTWISAADP